MLQAAYAKADVARTARIHAAERAPSPRRPPPLRGGGGDLRGGSAGVGVGASMRAQPRCGAHESREARRIPRLASPALHGLSFSAAAGPVWLACSPLHGNL